MDGDKTDAGFFSMGEHTLRVPMKLFALNRRRLRDRLRSLAPDGVVLLKGGKDVPINNTDMNYIFQQESYFFWTFGVEVPDFYGALDIATGRSFLFAPQIDENTEIYVGFLPTNQQLRKKYEVDHVFYVSELKEFLESLKPQVILTLHGVNSDNGMQIKEPVFDGISKFKVDNKILFPEITELRVIKTPMELDVLRYVNKVSYEAHKLVMRTMKPGMMEYMAEAIFKQYCYYTGGCRDSGYPCICTSGRNSSVLHYGFAGVPNNKKIDNGDMLLFDMGAKYCGYVADITLSYPVNGRFTQLQAAVYTAVLDAHDAVLSEVKAGVSWPDMHLLANRVMLTTLTEAGILTGDVDLMMKAYLGAVFQPHGLGHFMGLDVHDVGGYLPGLPPRIELPGLRNLRTARTLLAGMVITVEPGCYFIDKLLDAALQDRLQAKFLVPAMIEALRGSGGVRIESDIIVTEDGCELMTQVPRTVEDIEQYLSENRKTNLP